ncbi:MAG: hypothetical protein LBF76_01965, partial [Holosporales bacterium]|nr:hypothetical protein [Holosporales bacterium]
ATAALQIAAAVVRQHPQDKVLVVASDIARYGLNTSGEPTQGCGAVAFIVSSHPRLLQLEETSGLYTRHIMDFWRPNGQDEACVNGRYSTIAYLEALEKTWQDFLSKGGAPFEELAFTCFHTPFPRMAEKAFARHVTLAGKTRPSHPPLLTAALHYGRQLGNCYTAALYIYFLSLLEQSSQDFSGKRLGFFSYGSGCAAEFFAGLVPTGYQASLFCQEHEEVLKQRLPLTAPEYEDFYKRAHQPAFVPEPCYTTGPLCFLGIKNKKRCYISTSAV